MLLDGETLDLVQHVESVLAAAHGHELEPRINPELMQSVLEIATPVCHTPAEVEIELRKLRSYVTGIAREQGMRVGSAGTHPFSLFERQRITARDRYKHLVDQLQYVARRELIFGLHVHVAVDDPEKAIKVVNGLLDPPAVAARALGELAVLARRADRPRVEPADGLRRLPSLGPSPALQRLRGLRRGRRPPREDRLHRGLHAHLVGHPAAPALRHRRDPDLRRGQPSRGRGRARGLLPVAGEALLRAVRGGHGDPLVPPDPDHREQVARRPLRARGARDGPRDGPPQPRAGRPVSCGGRWTRSSRTRASSAASASSRASARSSRTGNGADRQRRAWKTGHDVTEVAREIADTTELAAAPALLPKVS